MNDIYLEEILINNKYARFVGSKETDIENHNQPVVVEGLMKTEELFNHLPKFMGYQTEILPTKCKFFKNLEDGSKILVLEDEPKIRTISFDYEPEADLEFLKIAGKYELYGLQKFKRSRPFKLSLSFPYIVYVLELSKNNEYHGLHVFFRLSPITSLDDYLLIPNLPNINDHFQVCLGFEKDYDNLKSLSDSAEEIISAFWFNNFNEDYPTNHHLYQGVPELSDYFTWAYNTKIDPHFIFSLKWLLCDKYPTLNHVIEDIKVNEKRIPPTVDIIKRIMKNSIEQTGGNTLDRITRDLTTSVLIPGKIPEENIFITVGDELKSKEKNYYVDGFVHDSFTDKFILLKDDENNTLKIPIPRYSYDNEEEIQEDEEGVENQKKPSFKEFIKDFQITNPTSVEINGQTIKTGDLILFKETSNMQAVEKIVKAKDNVYHIKVGRYFYLVSSFLNDKLEKSENLIINGVTLVKDKIYCILNLRSCGASFLSAFNGKYEGYRSEQGKLISRFSIKDEDVVSSIDVAMGDTNEYYLLKDDQITSPDFFRVNSAIITNRPSWKAKQRFFLIKNYGVGYDENEETMNKSGYVRSVLENYLLDVINNKKETVAFPSYERDLVYTTGDHVICIDWRKPEEMLKIRTITGFNIENDSFIIELKCGDEITKVPFINLETGIGRFEKIRKVCSEINNLKVGMRVKAKEKNICDFPRTAVNEIKAFVIDIGQPLVLFSNYRTLLLKDVNEENFNIILPETKEYQKTKLANPNKMKIKLQEGDTFLEEDYERILMFVYVSNRPSKRYWIKFKNEPTNSSLYIQDYRPSWQESMFAQHHQVGLLLPRFTPAQIKHMKNRKGIPTIFGEVVKHIRSMYASYNQCGIRRDWE